MRQLLLSQGTSAQCGNFFCPKTPQLSAATSAVARAPPAQCNNFFWSNSPQHSAAASAVPRHRSSARQLLLPQCAPA
eukprot:5041300-Pyramimonas_sp.AAC.1